MRSVKKKHTSLGNGVGIDIQFGILPLDRGPRKLEAISEV